MAAFELSNNGKIEIPAAFTAFKILPKDAVEESDGNMPKDAARAMMVFLSTGINNGTNAQKCSNAISTALKIFQAGPDGNKKVSVGHAILCWNCGNCGLPKNTTDFPASKTDGKMPPMAICSDCGGCDETNFLRIIQPDGSVVPWIEQCIVVGDDSTPTFASSLSTSATEVVAKAAEETQVAQASSAGSNAAPDGING